MEYDACLQQVYKGKVHGFKSTMAVMIVEDAGTVRQRAVASSYCSAGFVTSFAATTSSNSEHTKHIYYIRKHVSQCSKSIGIVEVVQVVCG